MIRLVERFRSRDENKMKRLTKLIVIVYLMTAVICPSFGFVKEQGSISYDVRLKKDELQAFERFQLIKADSDQEILIKAQKNQEELKIVSFLPPNNFPVYWWRSGGTGGDGYVQYLFKTPVTPGDYPVKIEGKTNSGEMVVFDFVLHVIEPGTIKNQIAVWESKGRIEKLTVKLRGNHEIVFPKRFESEDGPKVFTVLGALAGGYAAAAELDRINHMVWITVFPPLIYIGVYGAIGGVIGYGIDELFFRIGYYNMNIGWICAADAEESLGNIININKNVNVFSLDKQGKLVGAIPSGQFRRVIEEQYFDGQMWYKVKIEDQSIFEQ